MMRDEPERLSETALAEAVESFCERLRRRSLRVTDLRRALVRTVLRRTDHFQVDDLVQDLRDQGIRVSAATVYRVIPLLLEAKLIEATDRSQDRRLFEVSLGRDHHDHLVCSHCDKVIEFHDEELEALQEQVAHRLGFVLTDHVHELVGICEACRRRAPQN